MKQRISMKKSTDLTIQEACELFIRKGRIRNLSDNTLKTYRYHIDMFCAFMKKEQKIGNVTEKVIEDFILYLKDERELEDITVNSYLRTIRNFMYYCMDCGYLTQFKVAVPKFEKRIKETYSDEELRRLLKKPDMRKCSFTEYKTWVFENYLLGTGNRITSALNVKIGDIDFEAGTIIIRKTKSRRQQIIPLSRTLAEILKTYLEVRGGDFEDYLFCSNYGEQGDRRTYQQMVYDYNRKRNVNKTSCHLFRHTYAKMWVMAGGDVFRLQKILGHSDLTVTREYVQMFSNDLKTDFDKFNPLDKLACEKQSIKL